MVRARFTGTRAAAAGAFLLALLSILACSANARTISVDAAGTGDYPTIQAAVDDAQDGDEIVLEPGTYTGTGNYDVDFKGKAITVKGADPNVAEITIMDCQGLGRAFYLDGCGSAMIRNLTITKGRARQGGAIYLESSDLTISNCRITSNATTAGTTQGELDAGDGGAIYCLDSDLSVSDCLLNGNAAGTAAENMSGPSGNGGNGGVLLCTHSVVTFAGCTLNSNRAGSGGLAYEHSAGIGGSGGVIFCDQQSQLTLSNCQLMSNKAGDAGMSLMYGDAPSAGDGGALFCSNGSSVSIFDSVIGQNSTGHGGYEHTGYGGGIYCDSTTALDIRRCDIVNNQAGRAPGGAFYDVSTGGFGGGIYAESASVITIADSTITGNHSGPGGQGSIGGGGARSGYGGGVYCGSATVSGCTIADNWTPDGGDNVGGGNSGHGGGMYCTGALTISDSTISANRTGSGGNGSDDWGGDSGDGGGVWAASVRADGCDFIENSIGDAGKGGIHGPGGKGGSGAGVFCSSAVMTWCTFTANTTGSGGNTTFDGGNGGDGGGLRSNSVGLNHCVFSGNSTGDGVPSAGVLGRGGNGGGVYCTSGSLFNCLIVGNTTGSAWYGNGMGGPGLGGGIYAPGVSITSSTIANNATGDSRGSVNPAAASGGLLAGSGSVVVNSIISENIPAQIYGPFSNQSTYTGDNPGFIASGYWVDAADPGTVVEPNSPNASWVMGDYHLQQIAAGQDTDSVCVDAGNDTAAAILHSLTTRTDRVPDEGPVDQGYHYRQVLSDINNDGIVNMLDVSLICLQWGSMEDGASADIGPDPGGDGAVNASDLALVAQQWLQQ